MSVPGPCETTKSHLEPFVARAASIVIEGAIIRAIDEDNKAEGGFMVLTGNLGESRSFGQ